MHVSSRGNTISLKNFNNYLLVTTDRCTRNLKDNSCHGRGVFLKVLRIAFYVLRVWSCNAMQGFQGFAYMAMDSFDHPSSSSNVCVAYTDTDQTRFKRSCDKSCILAIESWTANQFSRIIRFFPVILLLQLFRRIRGIEISPIIRAESCRWLPHSLAWRYFIEMHFAKCPRG